MPRETGDALIRHFTTDGPVFSAAWQNVTCAGCRKRYQCTPSQDYYHEPAVIEAGTQTFENGYCMTCLCLRNRVHPDRVVNEDGSPA